MENRALADPNGANALKLLHLVTMFEYLNVCGREACPALDGAHSPINKDIELKQRYEDLRPGELAQAVKGDRQPPASEAPHRYPTGRSGPGEPLGNATTQSVERRPGWIEQQAATWSDLNRPGDR